jgi:hypothetical protein
MDRLTITKRHHTEIPSELIDENPQPDPTVRLYLTPHGSSKRPLAPFAPDVRTLPEDLFLEIAGSSHSSVRCASQGKDGRDLAIPGAPTPPPRQRFYSIPYRATVAGRCIRQRQQPPAQPQRAPPPRPSLPGDQDHGGASGGSWGTVYLIKGGSALWRIPFGADLSASKRSRCPAASGSSPRSAVIS